MSKKIVIIGGDAAGMSAASKAKRIDPGSNIIVFQDEDVVSYSACGIPYAVEGLVEEFDDLLVRRAQVFREKQGIDVRLNTRATRVDTKNKKVFARNLITGEDIVEDYDSLVMATGSRSFLPPIKGSDIQGVFTVKTLKDGDSIREFARHKKKAVIVGAGLIGIEMCQALGERGMEVTLVEMKEQVLPGFLDPDMAKLVEGKLEEKGVRLFLGKAIKEIAGDKSVTGIVLDGEILEAQVVILALGMVPNSELARDAGIELGARGAIRVNEKMETSMEGVYSAGDCATTRNLITGDEIYLPLGTIANRQGKVVGINIGGGNDSYPGVLGSGVTKAFEYIIGRTGLSEREAVERFQCVTSPIIKSSTRAHYYPGVQPIWIKLIAEKEGGKLIGAQIIGSEGVKERIDAMAIGIHKGITIREMVDVDTCYSPPVSPVWEPYVIAATTLLKKLEN